MTQKELEDIVLSDQYELKLLELHKQHKITLDLKELRENVTRFRDHQYMEGGKTQEQYQQEFDYYQRVLVEIDAIEKQSAI